MSDPMLEQRIAQFEKMATDDPDNDMAHFSLGGAYTAAGRHADAATSYLRCIELNDGMSKAYQLAGSALLEAGDTPRAGEVLLKGYETAASRGDLMPKRAIAEMLEKLEIDLPEVEKAPSGPTPDGSFICRRTSKPGTQMDRPPFRGPIGAWIQANISNETFQEWIGQGTKVINELRLDMSRDEDAETYDRHMHEYLGLDDAMIEELTSQKQA